jgi:ABC-type glutathione transport system ATPase component
MSAGNAQRILTVDRLVASLGHPKPTQILHGVSLHVDRGEVVGLIGETGSGKTTIARSILGLVPGVAGSIRLGPRDVTAAKGRARRRLRVEGAVQYVYQDPQRSLDPDFTIERSVVEGPAAQGVRPDERRKRVAEVLRQEGLDASFLHRRPGELSGGQRQRVAIARALAVNPELLICDEPVSALDPESRMQILELLRALARERNVGILLITHDLGSVAGIADRVVVLFHGHVVEQGAVSDVMVSPEHPYTRLLIGSAPTLRGEGIDRAERRRLRGLVEADIQLKPIN